MSTLESPLTLDAERRASLTNTQLYGRTVQPVLIILLVCSLFWGVTALLQTLSPDSIFYWNLLKIMIFLIACEGVLLTLWLDAPGQRLTERLIFRTAEVILLIVFARIIVWWGDGQFPTWGDWQLYLLYPLDFFDPFFVLFAVIFVLTWSRGVSITNLFSELNLSLGEQDYYALSPRERLERNDRIIPINRSALVKVFLRMWALSGILIVVSAALSTIALRELDRTNLEALVSLNRLNLPSLMLISLLIYFITGFLLFSQARFSALYARWLAEDVEPQAEVVSRWRRALAWSLIGIAVLVGFLPIPTRGTILISLILEALLGVVLFIFEILAFIVTILINLPLMLLAGGDGPRTATPPARLPPLEPAATAPQSGGPSVLTYTPGFLFWAGVGLVVIAAIFYILRETNITIDRAGWKMLKRALRDWWQGLIWRWRYGSQQIQELLGLPTIGKGEGRLFERGLRGRGWRSIRYDNLPPRERIRFFYLSALRRADEKGVGRPEASTPIEFETELKDALPEVEHEVENLTEAFLEARYSPEPIGEEETQPVKYTWQRVRQALGRRRKRRK